MSEFRAALSGNLGARIPAQYSATLSRTPIPAMLWRPHLSKAEPYVGAN
jgi:hypothetical protein